MVTNYTANEYGDFFVASIQQPYANVISVIDWDIVVGLKKRNMTGNVTGSVTSSNIYGYETQFDTSFAVGDSIIIGNITYQIANVISDTELTITEPIQYSFTNAQYYTTPDTVSFFEYEFRWSQTGGVFSEFAPLNHESGPKDIQGIAFDHTKPLYFDVKSEVAGLDSGNTLTFLSIEFTIETEAGVIESCPNFCTDCTDPFAMNGCANIQVTCNTNQFNPYALTKSVKMYKQLVNIVSGIFGHEVTYFKTEPDARTTDVILMEYSLHNVVDKKTIKILVPDNEFPTEAHTYDIFGIELEDFEIHITAEEFETQFGAGNYPRNKDYMFIPIINKMYEISSIALADEFNRSHSYWKVKLVKYQDRGDVIKGQFDDDTDVLITGIEEIFGERIQDEYKKNLKPEIFQTVVEKHHDGIRTFVDRKLRIVDYDLKNRWTIVSKNYYDFSRIDRGFEAVIYEVQSELKPQNNMAFSSWFAPRFPVNLIGNTYNLIGDTAGKFAISISNTHLFVVTPTASKTFTHGITFDPAKWYGYVVNINNKFLELSVSIYSLDTSNNKMLPQSASNNLTNEFTETKLLTQPLSWSSQAKFRLVSDEMLLTNIRVFDTPIEFEQHSNILNQYVVRDNQHALIIDNAIPSIGFQKYANAR